MYACTPEIKVLGKALKSQMNSFLVKQKKVIILLWLMLRIIKLYYFPCNKITSSKI